MPACPSPSQQVLLLMLWFMILSPDVSAWFSRHSYLFAHLLFFSSPTPSFNIRYLSPWEQGQLNQLSRACAGSQRLKGNTGPAVVCTGSSLFTLWGLLIMRAGVSLTHLMTKLLALLAITQMASNSSIKGYWDLRSGMFLGNLFTWGAQSVGILKHL